MTITRTHDLDDLYRLCVKENYCDMMNNQEYDAVLRLFKERGDDNDIIALIARDIARKSSKFRDDDYILDADHLDEYAEQVAFDIVNRACNYLVEM